MNSKQKKRRFISAALKENHYGQPRVNEVAMTIGPSSKLGNPPIVCHETQQHVWEWWCRFCRTKHATRVLPDDVVNGLVYRSSCCWHPDSIYRKTGYVLTLRKDNAP
jgi:hypothetical protein